ncbi:hypothetical protein ACQRET_03315 [Streptomyces koyangensis]|uniref:hypothetical protein n=1 Tax=Streptomyces koyangensis TaxID=188770 RepID=UPI003D0777BA
MSGTNGSVAAAASDVEHEVLCDDAGPFLRRYTSTAGGAPTVTDTELDGATPYTPSGTVTRCDVPGPAPLVEATVERVTGAGAVTIPAGARSVTVVVYAGAPTVAIGGGTATALPAGTSLTWGVNQGGAAGEALADELVFTGAGGDDFLVTTTREA